MQRKNIYKEFKKPKLFGKSKYGEIQEPLSRGVKVQIESTDDLQTFPRKRDKMTYSSMM